MGSGTAETGKRILIVDADKRRAVALRRLLSMHYTVSHAVCGRIALERTRTLQPDIVLLDAELSGDDGYDVCRRLRELAPYGHVKIIMVGSVATRRRVLAYESGADDFMTRPFDPGELLAKVRVYLRLKNEEEVNELKTDLLTLLSHETRTPLTYLSSAVQHLIASSGLSEEQLKFTEFIEHAADRIRDLVDKITMLGAMRMGTYEFKFRQVNVANVVEAAVSRISAHARSRGIVIERDLIPAITARIDVECMTEAIRVLLANAIAFSASGQAVSLRMRMEEGNLRIEVWDNARNIGSEEMPHVFEDFSSADVDHHGQGHGLDLAIARQTLLAHGGDIGVDSTPGRGTTFSILVPAKAPAMIGVKE